MLLPLHLCLLLSPGRPYLSRCEGGEGSSMRAQGPFFLPTSCPGSAPLPFGSEASADDGIPTLRFPGLPLPLGHHGCIPAFVRVPGRAEGPPAYSLHPAAAGLAGRLGLLVLGAVVRDTVPPAGHGRNGSAYEAMDT